MPSPHARPPLARAVDFFIDRPSVAATGEPVQRLARFTQQRSGRSIGAVTRLVGHPIHPFLTDLPIGFWTSAFLLDLVGGHEARGTSRTLIGAGLLCTVPTVIAGLHDAGTRADELDRQVVGAHATFNATATAAYAWSWWARRRGRWWEGVVLGMVGATLATAGGVLGGELAFGEKQ